MKLLVIKRTPCPACSNLGCEVFFRLANMPVSIGIQWPSALEAQQCRKGDIELAFCAQCGFIWNKSFDASRLEYSKRYDNSLDYSPTFIDYAEELARRLVESYGIRNKQVVELGCGKGHFLSLLCDIGNNCGVGFDPSFEGERVKSPAAERIQYFQEFYSEKFTHYHGDLICCRHVFEHIPNPVDFLSMVRRTIGESDSAVVYFEVPNVRLILERLSVWDIIYEHCSYFGRESLEHLFRHCGFHVLNLQEGFDGQFLSLEARLNTAKQEEKSGQLESTKLLQDCVQRFSERARAHRQLWSERLKDMQRRQRNVVVWGGGAKTVTFLNMLNVTDAITYVVDINPHKQGLHIAGTGQRIVSPEFLKQFQPDEVILMNPVYRREVERQLKFLGIAPVISES